MPLTVDTIPILCEHLAEVLGEIEDWGVKVNTAGRLPTILKLLQAVADAGEYPTTEEELMRVGNAIQIAQEFIEIGNTLPKQPIDVVADDLKIALGGSLEWRPQSKKHLPRQTQQVKSSSTPWSPTGRVDSYESLGRRS